MEEAEEELLHLENIVQAQAEEIEHLRSKGIFGFFQRRRLRKSREAGRMVHRLKEDELRQQNARLKERARILEEGTIILLRRIEEKSGGSKQ